MLDSKESRAFEEVPSTSLAFRADFDAHSGVGCTFSNLPCGSKAVSDSHLVHVHEKYLLSSQLLLQVLALDFGILALLPSSQLAQTLIVRQGDRYQLICRIMPKRLLTG